MDVVATGLLAEIPAEKGRVGRLRQARVAQILAAAVPLFAEKGFSGTSTAEIAARAALPKANVHYYFGTKDKMFRAVLDHILDLWLGAADHWITPERTPRDALSGYIRAKIALSRDEPDSSRIYASELLNGAPFLRDYLATALRRRVAGLAAVIAGWVAAGRMRPVDPVHLLFCIWAMTQTYADFSVQIGAVLDKPALDKRVFETGAETVCALVLNGLIMEDGDQ
jgi:TetR/AcrR family transcriptional regulator